MPLPSKIANVKVKQPSNKPVWDGPCGEGKNGGVTYSLLSRYLGCKERFRVMAMEGLKPREGFNHRLEFGNMWHVCEEAVGQEIRHFGHYVGTTNVEDMLKGYCQRLCDKYRFDQEEINHWYEVCKALFPVYLEYWTEQNPDKVKRTPLLREQVFDVPYKLPSGRVVRLRGKWDGVDLVGDKHIELYENKTKSQIDSGKIQKQLTFDLQTMMYLITLGTPKPGHSGAGRDVEGWPYGADIKGVRYNVVRRSAHKSVNSMMKKVAEDYRNGRIGEWFARWDVEVGQHDYEVFKNQCLHPILENLCDDYEWWSLIQSAPKGTASAFGHGRHSAFTHHYPRHFRLPYIYNPIAEGGFGDVDEYINSGYQNEVGLERVESLFPELES